MCAVDCRAWLVLCVRTGRLACLKQSMQMEPGDYPHDELHGRHNAGTAGSMCAERLASDKAHVEECFWWNCAVMHSAPMHGCSLDGNVTFQRRKASPCSMSRGGGCKAKDREDFPSEVTSVLLIASHIIASNASKAWTWQVFYNIRWALLLA